MRLKEDAGRITPKRVIPFSPPQPNIGGPAISGLDNEKNCGGTDNGQMCFTDDIHLIFTHQ
jgi:hypothetical protein